MREHYNNSTLPSAFGSANIKKYADSYKLTYLTHSWWSHAKVGKGKNRNAGINLEKLNNNINRAKSAILDLGLCNVWDWFVTFTIDRQKHDRYNLKTYQEDLKIWIKAFNRKYNTQLKYLLIPELHKPEKGETRQAWHLHGFMSGIPPDQPRKNENGYMEWFEYSDRFGNMSMSKVRDRHKSARYVTKYTGKGFENDLRKAINSHLYYCSRGLARGYVIHEGDLIRQQIPGGFESEHAIVKWSDDLKELVALFEL